MAKLEKGMVFNAKNVIDYAEGGVVSKELAKWQKELDMVGKKLSNERFVANAKPEVVQKERDKQADYQAKYDATVARIDEMKKLVG